MVKKAIFALIYSITMAAMCYSADGLTFDECLEKTLAYNPEIKAAQSRLGNAGWLKAKAFSSMLPKASVGYMRSYSYDNNLDDNGWSTDLTITQPLFHGFENLGSFAGRAYAEAIQEAQLNAKKLDIAERVAAGFYTCLSLQSELASYDESIKLMEKRLKEIRRRETLGKSRPSEVFSIESRLYSLKAQEDALENDFKNAREDLFLLTGIKAEMFSGGFDMSKAAGTEIPSADLAAKQPLVTAYRVQAEALSLSSLVKKGAFLPDVDVSASKNLGGEPYDSQAASVMLTAQWRFFEGGAKVFDAIAEDEAYKAAQQDYENALKTAENKIVKVKNNLDASIRRIDALKNALEASKKSARAQEDDYLLGMAANLDVIQAMIDVLDAKRTLDREEAAAARTLAVYNLLAGVK